MSTATDIAATYRGPAAVVDRHLDAGPQESRSLAWLMVACALMFVAQTPRLAREAHLDGLDFSMLMGGALMGWIFLAPLVFYAIALVSHFALRLFGRKSAGWTARVALFWALLAAAPVFLLLGLVGGFIGTGAQANIVGLLWIVVLLWFWISGLRRASARMAAA